MSRTESEISQQQGFQIQTTRLSPQQQHVLDLVESGASLCVSFAIEVEGDIDPNLLKRAVRQVADAHHVLHARFMRRSDGVVAQKEAETSLKWEADQSLRDVDSAQISERLDKMHAALCANHRDLWKRPALVLQLVALAPANHALLVSASPLCCDCRTIDLFAKAVADAYASLAQSDDYTFGGLQYVRFAEWQNGLAETPDPALDEARVYWSSRSIEPAKLGFAVRKNVPNAQTGLSGRIRKSLDKSVFSAAPTWLEGTGLTEQDFLFATWCALVWRWTSGGGGTIGFAVDGRSFDELRDVLGLMTRFLPIGLEAESMSFQSYAKRIRARVEEALEWQDYFLSTRNGQAPVSPNIGFEYTNWDGPFENDGLTWQVVDRNVQLEPFLVKLICAQTEKGLDIEMVYDAGICSGEAASGLLQAWLALVQDAARNPRQEIERLALTLPDSPANVLSGRVSKRDERCFHDLFTEQARAIPDAIALRYGAEEISYRELNDRAERLAAHLSELGAGLEDRVALFLPRSPALVAAILGVLKAGAAYVPLDGALPLARLSQVIDEAGPSVVIAHTEYEDRLPICMAPVVCVDDDLWPEGKAEARGGAHATPDNLAYVLFTSGSTGQPKGVMIAHRGLSNYLLWASQSYEAAKGNGTLVDTPVSFDLTITSLLLPLIVGQTATLLPEEQGVEALAKALRENRDITLVKTTPAHLDILRNVLPAEAAGASHTLVIGGEALNWDTISFWRSHSPKTRLVNEYGPTETVVGCCVYVASDGPSTGSAVPIGLPVDNARLVLLDDNLRPVPQGMPGELYIGGAGVARGYLNRPDLTAERFLPDPFSQKAGERLYKTGDLCRSLPDGNLEYLGRTDHQVKIRGFRIELGEIESVLRQHTAVQEAVTLAREDAPGEKRLVAYVVGKNGASKHSDELRDHVRAKLPEYMVPSAVVFLESMPLSQNGKIDRSALPAPDELNEGIAFLGPRTDVERVLVGIWEELLRRDGVGVTTSFFDLGGHSLLATQVISRVREAFQVDVPLRVIFEAPTIEQLAQAIQAGFDAREREEEQAMARLLDELEGLSDEEAREYLSEGLV